MPGRGKGSCVTPRDLPSDAHSASKLSGALVPRCLCRGHGNTVTHLDFSADGALLMSNCAAREVMLWAMPSGERIGSPGRLASDAQWLSQTCIFGFDRMGIWGRMRTDGAPVHAINAVHLIAGAPRGGGLLVAAGDVGDVRLLRSPCVVAEAPAREAMAHAGRVACVRFLNEGRRVVSAGQHDKVLVVWNVEEARWDE